MRITAIGRMWEWQFDYGDGKLSKNLVIPINQPIRLDLVSEDVNHSLFIPAFRVKEDVVPGYKNYLFRKNPCLFGLLKFYFSKSSLTKLSDVPPLT